MKKFLALILSAAMLLSFAVILSVPAAAVDGDWIVYGDPGEYYPDFDPVEDDYVPIPGYSYVSGQGLVVTPADWKDFGPKIGLSTRNKVHLKDGVYVLIRIDDFTYAGDIWFTYSISETQYLNVGSTNTEKYGERMSALVRPNADAKISSAQWGIKNWRSQGHTNMTYGDDKKYDNGKPLMELSVTWDGSTYGVTVNGAPAPESVITWLNEKFGENDEAYINFNTQNSTVGGTSALTVLKFGTSATTATIPQGDDSAVKRDNYKTIAEIANPNDVPANQPAVLINGSREASDAKGTTKNAGITSLTPENYIHYASDRANLELSFAPKYEVSYDIDDFPVIMVLTRNLCTCGESLADCIALEHADMYVMTGVDFSAQSSNKVSMIDICYEPIVRGEDSYLYFWVDTSDVEFLGWDAEGRFNGARFDIKAINTSVPGMNEFDICFVGLFRSVEEGEAYINEFVGPETPVDPGVDPGESETDPVEDVTEPKEDVSDVPGNTDQKPEDGKPEDNKPTDDDTVHSNTAVVGCFSSAGFGVIAMITLAGGASFIAFKKRK